MNLIILTGRLVKDIELRYTSSQVAVASFTLALDRGKDKDGNDKGADFPRCLAFGKTAEFLEKWTAKGKRITLIGRIQTGSYDKDGVKHYTTDIVAEKVEIIDWNDSKKQAAPSYDNSDIPEGFSALEDEALPF